MISSLTDTERIHLLLSDTEKPHFIGRIAGVELKVAHCVLEKTQMTRRDLLELENNAGIYVPTKESLKEYATELVHAYEACTMIGEWPSTGEVFQVTGVGQQYIARRTPAIPKCSALTLEPYYVRPTDLSWMSALKGKRVLILHPFIHTFQKQIKHLKELYPTRSWFEECEFYFIRPPLTLAGNHQGKDWRIHYEGCIQQVREKYQQAPFDIALVGAGGYSMLLSHFIFRELGTSVMYVGGALQLFFGVIGKRWFTHPDIMVHVNDYWTRPLKQDHPTEYKRVEKGCYW